MKSAKQLVSSILLSEGISYIEKKIKNIRRLHYGRNSGKTRPGGKRFGNRRTRSFAFFN